MRKKRKKKIEGKKEREREREREKEKEKKSSLPKMENMLFRLDIEKVQELRWPPTGAHSIEN